MLGIRVVLIGLLLGVLLHFLLNRRSARIQAGRKLLLVGFIGFAIIAVVLPDLVTALAHALGVGRGADLLLYLLALAFIYVALETRLKIADLEDRLAAVIQDIAVERGER